jgi:hypothetical protein
MVVFICANLRDGINHLLTPILQLLTRLKTRYQGELLSPLRKLCLDVDNHAPLFQPGIQFHQDIDATAQRAGQSMTHKSLPLGQQPTYLLL